MVATASHPQQESEQKASIGHLSAIARSVADHVSGAVKSMEQVNLQTRLLSFNARIEASRAGEHGRAFGVVATEIGTLSQRTAALTGELAQKTQAEVGRLTSTLEELGTEIRGQRLSDLALTNIDLIDRNLYERSCDVRWWATDSAVVDALTEPVPARLAHANRRLGVILDAYTVYYDIVLCDLAGRVVANGRPEKFRSIGSDQAGAAWFTSALATRNGGEYGFQSVHHTPSLAGGAHVLVYSCAVRTAGAADGQPLGVLGIVFNWEALAQTIVKRTLLSDEERPHTRVCIVDDHGTILADTRDELLTGRLDIPDRIGLFGVSKGHRVHAMGGRNVLHAHAASPGYETYRTGWHSVIVQTMV